MKCFNTLVSNVLIRVGNCFLSFSELANSSKSILPTTVPGMCLIILSLESTSLAYLLIGKAIHGPMLKILYSSQAFLI